MFFALDENGVFLRSARTRYGESAIEPFRTVVGRFAAHAFYRSIADGYSELVSFLVAVAIS
jgi:hypothetical protein